MNVDIIWNQALDIVRKKVSPISYNFWFSDIKLIKLENNKAIILVKNDSNDLNNQEQFIQSLIKNYNKLLEETINEIANDTYEIEFILEKDFENNIKYSNDENNIEENILDTDVTKYKYYSNFNPKYTFDSFIVGDSNRLAYGTALAVAKNPGRLYNPFFIHGKSGLGKTHLLHAIGNYIVNNSDLKVLYITTEQFINDYRSIVNYKEKADNNIAYLEAFRNKYRNVDVLMIDDIQFLETAPKPQIEFTNTFNSLYDNEKQIIIASDTSVKDFTYIAERLKTRFLGGLTEQISPPDFELKKEIIINKIQINDYNLDISEEIIDYIANNCGSDVRNLEGSVLRIVAYKAAFNIKELTLDIAKEALQEYTTNTTIYRKTDVNKIIDTVTKYYNLDVGAIRSKMRKKEVANARAVAMYLCRTKTYETVERIGLQFGGKDHSTISAAVKKINEELKTNNSLVNDIKILSEKICE